MVARVAANSQGELKKNLEEMHDNRIIEGPTSLWASPIILVCKNDGGNRVYARTTQDSITSHRKMHTPALSEFKLGCTGWSQVLLHD